jgi:hypothetical protein
MRTIDDFPVQTISVPDVEPENSAQEALTTEDDVKIEIAKFRVPVDTTGVLKVIVVGATDPSATTEESVYFEINVMYRNSSGTGLAVINQTAVVGTADSSLAPVVFTFEVVDDYISLAVEDVNLRIRWSVSQSLHAVGFTPILA